MATAVRVGALRRPERARPAWLSRAQEIIHARFRERLCSTRSPPRSTSPWHLARAFRRDFGMTIGEYARSLRPTWALDRLAKTSMPISAVAVAAGYTDQSHLTRACTAATGVGPAQYRRASRNAVIPSAARDLAVDCHPRVGRASGIISLTGPKSHMSIARLLLFSVDLRSRCLARLSFRAYGPPAKRVTIDGAVARTNTRTFAVLIRTEVSRPPTGLSKFRRRR
jgi:AraC-like DNA-binding protein